MRTRAATKKTILTPKDATTCSTVDYLRASVEQLEEAVLGAVESRSWQAVGSLKLRALQAREALDVAVAKEAAPDESMSDALERCSLLGLRTVGALARTQGALEALDDEIQAAGHQIGKLRVINRADTCFMTDIRVLVVYINRRIGIGS